MLSVFLLLISPALAAPTVEAPGLAPAPIAVPMAARIDAALAQRHHPGCASILALGETDEVREALLDATELEAPPWAPMRAASCLVDLAVTDASSAVALQDVVARADAPGLALAASERLDALSAAPARAIAEAAWATHGDKARIARRLGPLLAGSVHGPVRDLPAFDMENAGSQDPTAAPEE